MKPSFKKPLWYIRAGLLFLFPPILIFIVLPMGHLITSIFGGSKNLILAFLLGYPIVLYAACMFAEKLCNGKTYEISSKGITSNLDFLWKSRKEILFLNIKEVELKIGFFQKFFGIGTVVLHTLAQSNNIRTGFFLFDLEEPNKIYEILREKVSEANIIQRH